MSDPQRVSRLSVRETSVGECEVELDGQRVENDLVGVEMQIGVGDVSRAVLHVKPSALVDFEGYAHVAVGVAADPGPAAAVFLSAISAEELEKAALNRSDLGVGRHALTEAMLRQLTEWASGRA